MYYIMYFSHLFFINIFAFWLQANSNITKVFSKNIDWTQMFMLVSTKKLRGTDAFKLYWIFWM